MSQDQSDVTDMAGRQLQTMMSAALALAQAVAERRDRAVRDAARQAGAEAAEVERRAQADKRDHARSVPTAAEVAGVGQLSDRPARSAGDVSDGLRQAEAGEVARRWAEHTALRSDDERYRDEQSRSPAERSAGYDGPTALEIDEQRRWDEALRAMGADPDQARIEAVQVRRQILDPAIESQRAAAAVQDYAAAAVVLGGDTAADRAANRDRDDVLDQLHGPGWAEQLDAAATDGAEAGQRPAPKADTQTAVPLPRRDDGAEVGVGAWQNGAEAPRLAGAAQTARAGQSSLPGTRGNAMRRAPGVPGRSPNRAPELER